MNFGTQPYPVKLETDCDRKKSNWSEEKLVWEGEQVTDWSLTLTSEAQEEVEDCSSLMIGVLQSSKTCEVGHPHSSRRPKAALEWQKRADCYLLGVKSQERVV